MKHNRTDMPTPRASILVTAVAAIASAMGLRVSSPTDGREGNLPDNRVEFLERLYAEPSNRRQRREKKHGKKNRNHSNPANQTRR
jgi:hypothetical protein